MTTGVVTPDKGTYLAPGRGMNRAVPGLLLADRGSAPFRPSSPFVSTVDLFAGRPALGRVPGSVDPSRCRTAFDPAAAAIAAAETLCAAR